MEARQHGSELEPVGVRVADGLAASLFLALIVRVRAFLPSPGVPSFPALDSCNQVIGEGAFRTWCSADDPEYGREEVVYCIVTGFEDPGSDLRWIDCGQVELVVDGDVDNLRTEGAEVCALAVLMLRSN